MTQYIDKDALVAEIDKKLAITSYANYGAQRIWAYNDVKDIINYLDVKEVDLKKEIENYLSTYWPEKKEFHPFLGHMAKHFFELGLKAAQKGE